MVDGIPVEVTRKNVRNINLRIRRDGSVAASAPYRASEKSIRAFLNERAGWIASHQVRRIERESRRVDVDALTPADARAARGRLAAQLSDLVPVWEKRIGVKCTSWQIRKMTSRWGSCTVESGRIRFAFQLAFEPPECVELIVVHELCHLRERGHGPRFHALMDRYLPDWRERNKRLQ